MGTPPRAPESAVPGAPSRLLVLRLSALGDVIHTIPAVCALVSGLPGTRISWVVESPYRELVELVAGVEAIPVRMKKWGKNLRASKSEIAVAVRGMRGVDVSIDFQGLVKSAILGRISGARRRIGFDAASVREKAALLFSNERIRVDGSMHVIDQNRQLALAAGATSELAGADWQRYAHDPEKKLGSYRDAVVLLPGAGKPNKIWGVEPFRELSKRLGDRAVVAWGPGEREMAEAIGGRIAPATSLRELAHLLGHASVVVGGDTGPLHLAAALRTPVVGLYGPTNPRRNGPYGQLSHCVSTYDSTKLMASITVEEVMKNLERVIRA
jgi:heptosyltransferase I